MTFGFNYKAALQLDSTGHFFFWPAAYYEVLLSETTLFPLTLKVKFNQQGPSGQM